MRRPPFLKVKDQVVIVSPSGNVYPEYVNDTLDILQGWGLRVNISENALRETGRFSGFVEQRLSDLQLAMDDPEVKLIFCSRGGYGVAHLLDRLDFSAVKDNPKWLVGFSDITALHSAFQSHGIMSIHGPMAKHFSEEGSANISVQHTKSILLGEDLNYTIPVEYPLLNRIGKVTGALFGGNLSVYTSLLGSKYNKLPKNGILFIEDIGEEPYRIDRMIYQLKLSGVFNKIKGLIVGQFTEYEEDNRMYGTLYESILSAVQELDFPVCFGFPVGHTSINLPIVMGGKATLTIKEDTVFLKQRY
ncbi:MAG: LD-carboxypeptidase [Bacteroidales bacterium]|nr:LD-carboxypeptidase [Bacteroidales bacterium]